MKRGTKLLILFLVLAVMVGAYFLVSSIVRSNEEKAAEPDAAADSESLAVAESDAITGLAWTYLEQTVTLVPDEAGLWYSPEEPDCPVDQSIVEQMLLAASAVTGEKVVEQTEDLAEYGLAEPELTVTVTAGEESRSYAIGDYNAAAAAYYMTVDGGSDVYLEDGSLEEAFWYDLENLVSMESSPDAVSYLSLTVTTAKQERRLFYTGEPLSYSYTDAFAWFVSDGETNTPVDTSEAESLCGIAADIEWQRCVSWDADETAMTEYGFDEPQANIELTYLDANGDEQRYELLFGDYCDSDTVYVLQRDTGLIYTCYGTVLDTLKALDADSMVPEMALSLSGADTISVTLTVGETGRKLDPADESTAAFLEELSGLTVTGTADAEAGDELFRVGLDFASGAVASQEIVFGEYDSLDCVAILGDQSLLVSRTSVEALAETAADLIG